MRAVSLMIGLAAAGLSAAGCVGNGDDRPSLPATATEGGADARQGLDATVGNADAGDGGGEADAVGDAGGPGALSTPTLALLRMANWSPDAPAVDFCLARHGTGAFGVPVLGASAASIDDAGIDAGSGALPFPQISAYLLVEPAQYDARLVAAGSVDCTAGITQDVTSLPPLGVGGLETIAVVGAAHPQHGEPGLQIVGYLDELRNSLPNALIVRAINAAVDLPKAEIGTLTSYFTALLSAVFFGTSSAGDTMADPNGYVAELPIVSQTLAVRTAVASLLDAPVHTIVAQAPNVSLQGGSQRDARRRERRRAGPGRRGKRARSASRMHRQRRHRRTRRDLPGDLAMKPASVVPFVHRIRVAGTRPMEPLPDKAQPFTAAPRARRAKRGTHQDHRVRRSPSMTVAKTAMAAACCCHR